MNVDNINILDLVIDITRHNVTSNVQARFKHKDIVIKASMKCPKTLKDESATQSKILQYLGFNDLEIKRFLL